MVLDLKFCGITRKEDLKFCLDHQIPYVGLNFYRGSKRFVKNYQAVSLFEGLEYAKTACSTSLVAVVVNMSIDELDQLLNEIPFIKIIQFHGNETREFIKRFSKLHAGIKIWKAISIRDARDFQICQQFEDLVDMFVFDTLVNKAVNKQRELGGTGEKFDWELLAHYKSAKPFVLAGGIKSSMMASVLETKAMIADVCSGIEDAPGVKSKELMLSFIQNLRKTES